MIVMIVMMMIMMMIMMISPLNEIGTVKSVDCGTGFAGDQVTLTITGPDQTSVAGGMVVSDPASPVPVTARFQARIVVFNIETPITKGKQHGDNIRVHSC